MHDRYKHQTEHNRIFGKTKLSLIAAITAVVIVFLAIAAVLIYNDYSGVKAVEVNAEHNYNSGDSYRTIVLDGVTYTFNTHVRSILLAGLDTDDELVEHAQYGDYARADSIYLLLLDGMNNKLTIVPVSRDTMTEIRKFSKSGSDLGTINTHIGYAYSMGNGGKISCQNLMESVETLLYGVPIEEYMVISRGALEAFAALLGDVQVTLPGDEMTSIYPEMVKGATVTIDESNMRNFMVYRDTEADFSNQTRMDRQIVYIQSAAEKLLGLSKSELKALFDREEELNPYVQKSITRNQYLSLINMVTKLQEEDIQVVEIPGENVAGEVYDEFYPNMDDMRHLVLDLFYVKEN